MSTGKVNVTVLGGMLDGRVFTVPIATKALALTHTGNPDDAVTHICVRADDGRTYALHPITGHARMQAINETVKTILNAMIPEGERHATGIPGHGDHGPA